MFLPSYSPWHISVFFFDVLYGSLIFLSNNLLYPFCVFFFPPLFSSILGMSPLKRLSHSLHSLLLFYCFSSFFFVVVVFTSMTLFLLVFLKLCIVGSTKDKNFKLCLSIITEVAMWKPASRVINTTYICTH